MKSVSSSSRGVRTDQNSKDDPVTGLPRVNYYLPIVVTVLATLLIIVVIGLLTLISVGNTLNNLNRSTENSTAIASCCGVLSVIGAASTVYLMFALVKGVRDLTTPLYYARGTMLDKRILGGRKTGTWMGVGVRYLGHDLQTAQQITDDQRAAFPDRSKILQTRSSQDPVAAPPRTKRPGSYLPAERIAASRAVSSKAPRDAAIPRVVFRVDQASFQALEPDEEVLIAHSRYLQHIFFVAHIKGGEWETYRNRLLI